MNKKAKQMIGQIIKLNEQEIAIVKHIAKRRINHCRFVGAMVDIGHNNNKTKDQMDREINSYGGEIAYCKAFNLYPDFDIDQFRPYDAIHPHGETVDIKTTKWQGGHLAVKMYGPDKVYADYFALMTGQFPVYVYRGRIRSSELLRDSRLNSIRYDPPMYEVSQKELK